ncbi:MAG: hypothetical protein ACRENX_10960 [Candidatus Dormibacteria bacterium]
MSAAAAPLDGAGSTKLEERSLQVILALLLWTGIAYLSHTPPMPAWVEPLAPLPSLLLVTDALGPRPLGARFLRLHRSRRRWAAALILLASGLLLFQLTEAQPETDQAVLLKCASRSLLSNSDPYLLYEPQCAAEVGYRGVNLTPIATGPFAHLHRVPSPYQQRVAELRDQHSGGHGGFIPYGYPPDASLLLLPVAFGPWLAVWGYVMALCIVLLFCIWGRAPRPPGWVFLLALQVLSLSIMASAFTLGWDPEYLSYLLLALAFARIDQPRVSSLALAAAVCTNQLTWVALPIYLAITLRESDWRPRLSWLLGGLIVGVVPWWIWDHALPSEIAHVLTLPYFPGGQSIGALSSSPAHTVLYLLGLLAGIAACTVIAWRYGSWRWAMAGVVWGSFILSPRGFGYYFLPMFWLSPAILLGAWRLGRAHLSAATVNFQQPA